MKCLRQLFDILNQAFGKYSKDQVPRLGAALSFYTLFSLAPIIVIATAIAAFVLGPNAVQGELNKTLQSLVGPNGATAIQNMAAAAYRTGGGTLATVISTVVLLVGAAGVFYELRSSMNLIWEVESRPDAGVWATVRNWGMALVMVLAVGVLLLATVLANSALVTAAERVGSALPGGTLLWQFAGGLISLAILTVVFALLFKYVPEATIAWRDVWHGATFTAVLFLIGNFLIGLYIAKSGVASAYGAAGSLIVVLTWVYFTSQIVFFGAEFTRVYANTRGSRAGTERSSQRDPRANA